MKRTVDVEYSGITFTVKGNWERGYAETRLDPGQADGFDEAYIYIDDNDVSDVLDSKVIESIIELATEECISEDN